MNKPSCRGNRHDLTSSWHSVNGPTDQTLNCTTQKRNGCVIYQQISKATCVTEMLCNDRDHRRALPSFPASANIIQNHPVSCQNADRQNQIKVFKMQAFDVLCFGGSDFDGPNSLLVPLTGINA